MFRKSYGVELKKGQTLKLVPVGDIHFDCVGVDHRVLTAELRWKPAGLLKAGERLIGLEEYSAPGRNGSRELRYATIISHRIEARECVEVELETGERIVTTATHPWLTRFHGLQWRAAFKLRLGQKVVRPFRTWDENRSWEAGWLSGFFDGEGTLVFGGKKRILTVQASQRPGAVLEQAKAFMTALGFSYRVYKQSGTDVHIIRVMGGTGEIVRFLGVVRPIRLLKKLPVESLRSRRGTLCVRIVKVKPCGLQPVAVMGTTARTYFADGYAMHNTDECDRERLADLVVWARREESYGHVIRFCGLGDYLDFLSPSNRSRLSAAELYDTARKQIEERMWDRLKEFSAFMAPTQGRWLGLLTGHHSYTFGIEKTSGKWIGRCSDEWIARQFNADYWGDGTALIRLRLPHAQFLDVFLYHGSGGAQTPGGRLQKRMRFAEIAPTAHIVITGHDNAKLAYPRSGLDYSLGAIKRYVVGSGSFQRAYMQGHAGYAEKGGLVPADLGVVVINIQVVERKGQYRVDFHASV